MIASVAEAHRSFSWERAWELFDGDEQRLNLAHECVDRHPPDAVAVRVARRGDPPTTMTFGELSRRSSQMAHALEAMGVARAEPVGLMVEPSAQFYAALFGILKRGAVAVPLYTMFGPEAIRDRVEDCGASLLLVDSHTAERTASLPSRLIDVDGELGRVAADAPGSYLATTRAADVAVLQYTSGTTRRLPEAVRHDHRSIVTLSRAALYGVGL